MMSDAQPKPCSNIIAETALFIEWAEETGLLNMISAATPLTRINGMTARQSVHRAIGYLAQGGVSLRNLWGLEDLIQPDAFTTITQNALLKSRPEAQCMAFVLLLVAREWIELDDLHMKKLEGIAAKLPPTAFSRSFKFRRSRVGQMYPLRRQDVRVKTPA